MAAVVKLAGRKHRPAVILRIERSFLIKIDPAAGIAGLMILLEHLQDLFFYRLTLTYTQPIDKYSSASARQAD